MRSLPLLPRSPDPRSTLTELQALGARWIGPAGAGLSRVGGAGPSDHKAIVFAGHTVMVPIHTAAASTSPFALRATGPSTARLERDGVGAGDVTFPAAPRFYERTT